MSRLTAAVVPTVVALLLMPSALGMGRYAITGRSMGDALPVGSLAFTRDARAADVRAGDVITFRPPGMRATVTHRVVASADGALRTRGDANRAADPWRLDGRVAMRRVVFHLPLAGYATAALRGPVVLVLLALLLLAVGVPELRTRKVVAS